MRIVYMGTPDFAVAPLEKLIAEGYEVAGVFTQQDKPKNRGMKLTPPPVKIAAEKHRIPVFQPRSFKTEEAFEMLRGLNPDLVVVTAYGKLLPKRVLELPVHGCINVHASLLPDYRGASPIQQVLLRDEKETGVTIMQMNEGLDTGDMLLQKKLAIEPRETAGSLHDKLAELGAEALIEAVKALDAGKITRTPQPAECSFYAPLIQKGDGSIDFGRSARQIDCQARALQPWPGTFAFLGDQMIKFFGICTKQQSHAQPIGAIMGCDEEGMQVACKDGVVMISELQAPGGKRMRCADYFRGHPSEKNGCFHN